MCHILIVEDEKNLSAFVEKGLRKNGFQTTVVADGQQAIALTRQSHFDLVLLDLGLPIVDGWAVIETLRDRGDSTPIIIMTARNHLRTEAIAAGASDLIQKPFRFAHLMATVKASLPHPPAAGSTSDAL